MGVELILKRKDAQRYAGHITAQDDRRRERGIRAQPVFDINGGIVVGISFFPTLDGVIQEQLAAVE